MSLKICIWEYSRHHKKAISKFTPITRDSQPIQHQEDTHPVSVTTISILKLSISFFKLPDVNILSTFRPCLCKNATAKLSLTLLCDSDDYMNSNIKVHFVLTQGRGEQPCKDPAKDESIEYVNDELFDLDASYSLKLANKTFSWNGTPSFSLSLLKRCFPMKYHIQITDGAERKGMACTTTQ